jgi:hypothetical protein
MRRPNRPKEPGIYGFKYNGGEVFPVRVFEKDGSLWQKAVEGTDIAVRVDEIEDEGFWSDRLDDDPTG